MATKTAEKTDTQTPQQAPRENVPALSGPRLPYHPAIEQRFGVDKSAWKALVEAVFPLAQSAESVILALSYCKARRLDPFKRVVHIVPIYDKNKRRMVDTIWPGIGEVRTTAVRTGVYAGKDETEFGPEIERTWPATTAEGYQGKVIELPEINMKAPEWARVTVYKIVQGHRVAFVGPKVYWMETFAEDKHGRPNSMWQKRISGQLEKCAEAAALRTAFPDELGDQYIDLEAAAIYQHSDGTMGGIEPKNVTPKRPDRADYQDSPPAEAPESSEADHTHAGPGTAEDDSGAEGGPLKMFTDKAHGFTDLREFEEWYGTQADLLPEVLNEGELADADKAVEHVRAKLSGQQETMRV